MIDAALRDAVERFALHPTVLVASDYDGTLAELVDDPERALPNAASIDALRRLAALPGVHIALVSGRALADLVILSQLGSEAHLVGSHGGERVLGVVAGMDAETTELLEQLHGDVARLARGVAGIRIERKPASVTLHTREVEPHLVAALETAVLAGPGSRPGVAVKRGKDVLELAVVDTDKGTALGQLRTAAHADALLYIGDDLTDEDAFAVLGPHDVGVKVGPGPTAAAYRVADVDAVAELLSLVGSARAALE